MTSGSDSNGEAVCDTVTPPATTMEDEAPNEESREPTNEQVDTEDAQCFEKEPTDAPQDSSSESEVKSPKKEDYTGHTAPRNRTHELPPNHVKFFVGGLHPLIDEDALSNYFKKYGSIVTVQVMRDYATKRSRGFGFVTMISQENTDSVYSDYHVIDGKKVDVRHMQADPNLTIKRKIFVGGISRSMNENMLEEYFGNFGTVEKVLIMRQPDGSNRGFGFVQFSTDGSAEKVLESPSHFVHGARVDVRPAETRSKQLHSRNDQHYGGGNYQSQGGRRDRDYSRMHQYAQPMIPGMPPSHQSGMPAYDPQLLQQHLLYQQYALQGQYAYFAQQQQQQQKHPEDNQSGNKDQLRYMAYRPNTFGNQPYSQNNLARSYRHDPY